ncbi:MAG: mechanosensitive ion channel [Proteobacteria bacterium]|nr:mechanosensitive ion channel [Burkholderiales bacterium]
MAQSPAVNEVQSLIASLASDLQEVKIAWQLGAIAVSLALAWLINLWLRPRMAGIEGRWKAGVAGIQRALFPISALVFLLTFKAVLARWNPTSLLRLAAALLVAMAIVRVVAYLLRSAFTKSDALDAWERLIGWTVWIGLALYLTDLLPSIIEFLDDVTFPVGKRQVSLLLLVNGAFSIVITLLIVLWIGRLLENRLMAAPALDMNLRVIFAKLTRALLIVIGVLFALSAVGLDITLLSVFGGALGVGLGFGLQKIASNYVSGFIILADRSISIGNMVKIDDREGIVTRMTARYVVLRNLDGTEAIIPNETIITNTVVSLSYSDPRVQVAVPLQIAYGSDLEATIALLESIAKEHPRVLAEPPPSVMVQRFDESGINLELGVWINDPEFGRGNLRSELFRSIWHAFRDQGIQIPYPQREVRVIGTPPPESAAVPEGTIEPTTGAANP